MMDTDLKFNNLESLFQSLWKARMIHFVIWGIVISIFLINFLLAPSMYRSEIMVEPIIYSEQNNAVSSLGNLAKNIPGSAALGGLLNSDGEKNPVQIGIEEFRSKKFLTDFLIENNLLIDFFAIKKYQNNKPIFDQKIYSTKEKKWLRPIDINGFSAPNSNDIQKRFKKLVMVETDPESGLVRISLDFYDPARSQYILSKLISDFNEYKRQQAILRANNSVEYINEQIARITKLDIRNIFYNLIEEQLKNIVLSETRKDYFFRIIDPASLPDEKSNISFALTIVLATVLSILLSSMLVIFTFSYGNNFLSIRLKNLLR